MIQLLIFLQFPFHASYASYASFGNFFMEMILLTPCGSSWAPVATASFTAGCTGSNFSSAKCPAMGFFPAAFPMLTVWGRVGAPTCREASLSLTKLAPQQKISDRNEGFCVLASIGFLRDDLEGGATLLLLPAPLPLPLLVPDDWSLVGLAEAAVVSREESRNGLMTLAEGGGGMTSR